MHYEGTLPKRPWTRRTITANAYVAQGAMRRVLEEELAMMPVDTLAAVILRMLDLRAGACSMGVFSVELSLPPSTATSAVARLERRGWARRHRGAPDGRVVIAELTSEGRVAAREIRKAIDALEIDIERSAGSDLLVEFNRIASYLGTVDDRRRW